MLFTHVCIHVCTYVYVLLPNWSDCPTYGLHIHVHVSEVWTPCWLARLRTWMHYVHLHRMLLAGTWCLNRVVLLHFCPYYAKAGHFVGLLGRGTFGVKSGLPLPNRTVCSMHTFDNSLTKLFANGCQHPSLNYRCCLFKAEFQNFSPQTFSALVMHV